MGQPGPTLTKGTLHCSPSGGGDMPKAVKSITAAWRDADKKLLSVPLSANETL